MTESNQSRSVQRRIAAQKGLPAPDFSKSEWGQLREKIAEYLTAQFLGKTDSFPVDECYSEADHIINNFKDAFPALAKEEGYVPPDECKQCQQKQIEAEKMLNREAAYEEERLRGEVEYWKEKDYRLG